MGYLYQQRQRDGTKGGPWWIKYYVNGKCMRESTGTTEVKKAERMLKEREGRAAVGLPIPRRLDRMRYKELAKDLRLHYQTTGERDLKEPRIASNRSMLFSPGAGSSVSTAP